MSAEAAQPPLDVLVVGGGQAGLAMGHHLAELGLRFSILDAGPQVGHVWRSRWDSLRLFTSGRYDSLPGFPFPADADSYPGKDAVADYLQAYVNEFGLPVRRHTTATSLTRADDGSYLVKAGTDDKDGAVGEPVGVPVVGRVHLDDVAVEIPR